MNTNTNNNTDWPSMQAIVPEGERGDVRVRHFTVSPEQSEVTRMRAIFNPYAFVPAGNYCKLEVGHEVMMSDTPMERRTCAEVVRNANGKVLIAGLGLGWILHPILAKPEVTEVTVLEINPDVLALVAPGIPDDPRLTIIEADALAWTPPKGKLYDCVWFDIWPTICEDNLDDIGKLNRKYARRMNKDNPKAWRGSWCEDDLRRIRKGGIYSLL